MINIYYGPVANPRTLIHFDALPRCLIAVGDNGNILWKEDNVEASNLHTTIAAHGLKPGEYHLVDFTSKPCEFIMPGLIDSHVHACQFPIMGVGGDDELLNWLQKYVYPAESKFKDEAYAELAYRDVVDRSIASGTTTSCYYSSLHLDTTITLAKIVREKGQRAFVGKCNMDHDAPEWYIDESPEQSIEDTITLINQIQSLPPSPAGESLVHPIIAPRFALACSDALLKKLCNLVKHYPDIAIETHICENRKEVKETLKRFRTDSYAAVYASFGLLRHNTILGHGVWLTEKDMNLIRECGAGVAHCPASNFYLSSGMARVGSMLDHGIKVGLGTDVSGGNNPSMLYAIQMASTASKMIAVQAEVDSETGSELEMAHHDDPALSGHSKGCNHHHHLESTPVVQTFTNRKLTTATLLYLATLGGASLCCLSARIGSFESGKAFDALHVSLDDACGNPAVWGRMVDAEERKATPENIKMWVERFFFGGDGRNVRKVWVQGLVVGGMDGGGQCEREAGGVSECSR